MDRTLWALGSLTVTAAMMAEPILSSQAVTFRSTTELVLVDALVTRGNTPVDGLRPEDFDVRDAGVRQKVESVLLESMPIDLLIALDVSASLAGERLEHLKSAVRAAVGALRPIDRVLLLDFSNDIRLASGWTNDREQVQRAVDSLRAEGWTSVIDATFTALALPDAPDHRPLLLLVTDGRDTASWLSPAAVLKTAERSRTTVYGVSTATGLRRTSPAILREYLLAEPAAYRALFLPVIVNDTGGELLQTSGRDLGETFVDVLTRFRRRYVLSYTPTGVPRSGWHPLEVRVKDPSMSVTARRGYTR